MRKFLLSLMFLGVAACATPLEYDKAKFSISPAVKLLNINSNAAMRERDGQVMAQVSGTSSKNQAVYYKVEWFDANGMKISTSLAQWKKVNLRENSEFFWKAAAPSQRAATYRVYITDDIGKGIIE
ncbi:MAG: YcfL family protein [Alphaproteobacteria bacterium]|nr:YcfL family protein [Alphaproteobacteria bacterium]